MEENDSRNYIIAIIITGLLLMSWLFFFGPEPAPDQPEPTPEQAQQMEEQAESEMVAREIAVAQDKRVPIDAERVGGTIDLKGGRLDDLILKDYKETIAEGSPEVKLLSPQNTAQAYFAQTSFVGIEGIERADLPGNDTQWTVKSGDVLTSSTPVTLAWTSPNGFEYEREIAVDKNFMFIITDRVTNNSGANAVVQPYAFVSYLGEDSRVETIPQTRGNSASYILHEGAISNIDGTIEEDDFDDIQDGESTQIPGNTVMRYQVEEKGWTGFTTKYWMTTLAPQTGEKFNAVLRYVSNTDTYTSEAYFEQANLAAGETVEHSIRVYSGAKEVEVIRDYRDELNIDRFDDAVDWGWFYILTKPIFWLLHWLHGFIGNMGLSIIALTLVIKTILFPLAYRSFVSMSRMKKLQPEMEKIKEAAGDDRMKMQQMTMELYRKEKVNPVSGCLPIFLQIPIFFSLYKVLYVTTEMRHAPFFGPWQDLSAPDPTSIFNLFGLLPWGAPGPESILSLVALGILPILLGISMWATQKLNPTPTEPTQAMIFRWMPWVFMFMMGGFATGLLIYWITNNTLTFIQQYTIMRSQGVKPDLLGNIIGRKDKADAK